MRVIAGSLRGRKLASPEGRGTRPTSDRLRESLFNILTHRLEAGFEGIDVADIFAGTGALGIEAISRGAKSAIFVEKHAGRDSAIYKNIQSLGLEKVSKLLSINASNLPKRTAGLDLILMDPPYLKGLADIALKSIVDNWWCKEGTIVVVEAHINDEIEIPIELHELDNRAYGKTKIMILKFGSPAAE